MQSEKTSGTSGGLRVSSSDIERARAYPFFEIRASGGLRPAKFALDERAGGPSPRLDTSLLVAQFEKFQVLFVYRIHILVFSDLLTILTYWAYPLPNGWGMPIGANFLISSPIWEISSSICISHTYFSVFWPFWPTGHPRICPGIPTTQWLLFLMVQRVLL